MLGRGIAIAGCALLAAAAPAAASQGSDAVTRGDHLGYYADPGETNQLTIDPTAVGLHLSDQGAVIKWLTIPTFGNCEGGLHDVFCVDGGGGFAIYGSLGDGNDTYVDNVGINADGFDLGSGNNVARVVDTGPDQPYVSFTAGTGADDISGGGSNWDQFTYANSPGPVTVTADDIANDGMAGEGDNIRSTIDIVEGSAFDDHISGYLSAFGGAGNDVIDIRDGRTGDASCGAGDDTVVADAQDTVQSDCENVTIG